MVDAKFFIKIIGWLEDNKYNVRDAGCSCCSENYELTKEEYIKLLNDGMKIIKNEINAVITQISEN